jgi:Tfp pilus assembly protein PilV
MTRSITSVTTSAPPRSRRGRAAFTIVEVTVATFVMAFGIATALIVMQAGFKQIDLARSTTIASQVIQSEMERLRMMSWTGITALQASNPTQTFDGATYFSSNAKVAGDFTMTRTITDNAAHADMKDIMVNVTWRGYDGRSHSRSFTMLYALNGLYDYYYTIAHP